VVDIVAIGGDEENGTPFSPFVFTKDEERINYLFLILLKEGITASPFTMRCRMSESWITPELSMMRFP